MALRITVNSSRVLRVEKIPPRFFLTRTRDSLSTRFGEKFWGERICLIPWSKSNNLPSVLHGRRKSRIFVQLGSESRILPPANARIFTIRMRIEANLIALRQLTLSDENVSSPILLLRTSTHTHTHIYMHIFLSPLCSTSPRQTTKFQPQFRQVIDIIRLLDTRCIRWICMKGLTRKSWKSGGMPRRVRDGQETATNSHRNRSLLPVSISDGAREREKEREYRLIISLETNFVHGRRNWDNYVEKRGRFGGNRPYPIFARPTLTKIDEGIRLPFPNFPPLFPRDGEKLQNDRKIENFLFRGLNLDLDSRSMIHGEKEREREI